MNTDHDTIRGHIYSQLGLINRKPLPSLEEIQATQWSEEFERLRRSRMVMGAFRYGLMSSQKKMNNTKSMIDRLMK